MLEIKSDVILEYKKEHDPFDAIRKDVVQGAFDDFLSQMRSRVIPLLSLEDKVIIILKGFFSVSNRQVSAYVETENEALRLSIIEIVG